MVTALIASVLFFIVAGLALSRLAGPLSWFLGGAGVVGAVIFVAGVIGIPIAIATVILLVIAAIVIATRTRRTRLVWSFSESIRPVIPSIAMAIAALALLFIAAMTPTTDYDGRAFWLMKAKAMRNWLNNAMSSWKESCSAFVSWVPVRTS